MARWLSAPVGMLAVALAVLACGEAPSTAPPSATAGQRTNIVLVIVDTLRADALGAYGHAEATSPEIDALARRGVRFADVVAQSSWTRPSIASMLTALHPHSVGIYKEERQILDGRFTTLAEVLRAHGYATFGATANPNINAAFGFDQGFDHYRDSHVVWSWMTERPGELSSDDTPLPAATDLLAAVEAWLESGPAPPYYLQLNLMEVHEFRRDEVRARVAEELFAEHPQGDYLRAVRYVARQIGKLVESLAARPEWARTIFVVTSDHGEGLDDHPAVPHSKGHGWTLYESNLRVPLVLADTAGLLPAGRVVERPVRLLDLVPTLLDLVGVPAPDGLEGVSLTPLIRGADDLEDLPRHFVVTTEFMRADKIGVYSPEWIYIENRDGHPGTNPIALQSVGGAQNGRETDAGDLHPDVRLELGRWLRLWEAGHPKVDPVLAGGALSASELEQLRALGYLQGAGGDP